MRMWAVFLYLFVGGLMVGGGMVSRAERCGGLIDIPDSIEMATMAATWPVALGTVLALVIHDRDDEITAALPCSDKETGQ